MKTCKKGLHIYNKNKKQCPECQKQYHLINADKIKKRKISYYKSNADKIKQYDSLYYKNNIKTN